MALLHGTRLLFADRAGTLVWQARLSYAGEGLVFSPEGELWVFDGAVLHRYAP